MAPEQLWVSDITYIKTMEGYSYLSLITDAYSRKIVGYCLYPDLSSEGPIEALVMATQERQYLDSFLVHHSDRGVLYCSGMYVEILNSNNIAISMIQSGNLYDNALAERMNGIIKSEFFWKKMYQNHKEAKKAIANIVKIYNTRRPHSSLNYKTPTEAHSLQGVITKRCKSYKKPYAQYKISKEENIN